MLKLIRRFIVALICPAAALSPSWASAGCLKKGVATNQASLPQQLHVPWYYDWSITPLRVVPNGHLEKLALPSAAQIRFKVLML